LVTKNPIGVILTGATTQKATCQLFESSERGGVREGKFLLIESMPGKRQIMVRVAAIIPQNDFYGAGDAWTEARRKQVEIPGQLARQYEICELDLLAEMPGARPIAVPPFPNDKIYEMKLPEEAENIFGVSKKSPGIIWYGTMTGYQNAPIPLNIESIPMHIGVFGTTGSGKSYDTGALIEQLVKICDKEDRILSFPILIIDANGDYLDYVKFFEDHEKFGAASAITRYVFPGSPELSKMNVKPIAIDLNLLRKREIAEAINLYYSGGEKTELQVAGLEKLIAHMEETSLISEGNYQSVFTDDSRFGDAKEALSNANLGISGPTVAAINRALEKFKGVEDNYNLMSEEPKLDKSFVDNLTKNREIAIMDFSAAGAPGVDPPLKQFVMSYLASILFRVFTEYKIEGQERYMLFIIEEAQNYCPNLSAYNIGYSLAREKLAAIATQGRKFGLSLCLISQRPSFVDQVVLSMCNTFFLHRISPEDLSFVKRVTGGLPSSLERRLTILGNGELIVSGQMLTLPFPMLIKVPFPREVPQTTGKTDVLGALRRMASK
jgi:DNA helicase HerA-like ATPase